MAGATITAFDLDGTLLNGQSGTLVLGYLMRHRYISAKTFASCAWWGVRFKLHLPFRQNEVREHIFAELSRFSAPEVQAIMDDFHREVMVPRYREAGIRTLREHIANGEHVALVSATFDQIAQAARAYLGCEVAHATKMQLDAEGRFTGNVDGNTIAGPAKLGCIRRWANETFGAGGWDLAFAYGDHFTDVPMLEAARKCYAVNPGPTLKREARSRGWQILDWK